MQVAGLLYAVKPCGGGRQRQNPPANPCTKGLNVGPQCWDGTGSPGLVVSYCIESVWRQRSLRTLSLYTVQYSSDYAHGFSQLICLRVSEDIERVSVYKAG